jgi:hypothetical protein
MVFIAVGIAAVASLTLVYARYWSRGDSAPVPLAAAIGLIFVNAVNVTTRTNDTRYLIIKGLVAALTLAAVAYLVRIGLR